MENIAIEIAETARLLRREANRRFAQLGTTGAQWRVLARLKLSDGRRQVELAEALDVEPITLCRMVDRLEEAGLVERRKDPEDRRAWRIFLTDAAAPIVARMQTAGEALNTELFDGVAAPDVATARRVLAQVRANLERSDPDLEIAS
ncbi:MAG: MarR family winged helix-turn-helix transcriptional regulator [Allosphingosinicella sp.]